MCSQNTCFGVFFFFLKNVFVINEKIQHEMAWKCICTFKITSSADLQRLEVLFFSLHLSFLVHTESPGSSEKINYFTRALTQRAYCQDIFCFQHWSAGDMTGKHMCWLGNQSSIQWQQRSIECAVFTGVPTTLLCHQVTEAYLYTATE